MHKALAYTAVVRVGVFLLLIQQGKVKASEQAGGEGPSVAGWRRPSPLPDGVDWRVSKADQRQPVLQPRVLSHVSWVAEVASASSLWAMPLSPPRSRPREEGRPLGQCEPGAASSRASSHPLLLLPGPQPPLCRRLWSSFFDLVPVTT